MLGTVAQETEETAGGGETRKLLLTREALELPIVMQVPCPQWHQKGSRPRVKRMGSNIDK